MPKKGGLGRGIEAIFEGIEDIDNSDRIVVLELDSIKPNPFQPRESFDDRDLEELAESIKQKGLIQPIIVREIDGEYEIVAGERRFLAAKLAGLSSIPAIIKQLSDKESAEIALIENVQRKDLNPIEEALAYKRLIETFGYTQEEVAQKIGKDRATISNSLRLLKLPEPILDMLKKGEISAGHARAILSLKNQNKQVEFANRIKEKKLSVREAEKEVYLSSQDEFLLEIKNRLKSTLSVSKISVSLKNGKYKLELVFDNKEVVEDFLRRIS